MDDSDNAGMAMANVSDLEPGSLAGTGKKRKVGDDLAAAAGVEIPAFVNDFSPDDFAVQDEDSNIFAEPVQAEGGEGKPQRRVCDLINQIACTRTSLFFEPETSSFRVLDGDQLHKDFLALRGTKTEVASPLDSLCDVSYSLGHALASTRTAPSRKCTEHTRSLKANDGQRRAQSLSPKRKPFLCQSQLALSLLDRSPRLCLTNSLPAKCHPTVIARRL